MTAKGSATPGAVFAAAGPLSGTVSATGYELPAGLSYEAWAAEGSVLIAMAQASMWWVGDWIRYGEHNYGEKYAQAIEATGHAIQTLRNAVWVCDRIPPSQRRAGLPFSIHKAVAGLEPKERREVLDRAEVDHLSEYDVRAEVKRLRAETTGAAEPTGKPEVVEHQGEKVHYPTLREVARSSVEALQNAQRRKSWKGVSLVVEALLSALEREEAQ